jgi:hypothetical protein
MAGRHRKRRLGAAAVGVVAIFAAVALAGCSAGQIAETATIVSAVPGGSASVAVPTEQNPNGALLIKNVTVDYNGVSGYAAGATATLSVWLANQSTKPVTVTAGDSQLIDPTKESQLTPLGTVSLAGQSPDVVNLQNGPSAPATGATTVPPASAPPSAPPSPAPSGSPSASPTPTPAAPTAATVTIQPGTMQILSTSAGPTAQYLQIAGLKAPVVPGNTVQLTFNVTSDGQPMGSAQVVAPVAPPASPAPRVSDTGFPPSLKPST